MTQSNFCSRPFNEINFDTDGTISPCCVINGRKYDSVEDYLSSDYLQKIRSDLLNNVKTPACRACWEYEGIGAWSNRINESYTDDNSILNCHIKFSNKCNFKCRMCSGKLSSAIGVEEKRKNPITLAFSNKHIKKYIYTELLPNLKLINISGGEPLLSDDHLEFLKIAYLINPNVHISYNSNISTTSYKGVDFRSLWKHYKLVSIIASIDGHGKSQEYQRFGSSWEKIESNMLELREYIKDIHCCVSIYTIYHLPDLINWCMKYNFDIKFYAVGQKWLQIDTLPHSLKQDILAKFKLLSPDNEDLAKQIVSLLKSLQNNPGNLKTYNLQFKNSTEYKDNIRNQSFVEINPQFKDWYERI